MPDLVVYMPDKNWLVLMEYGALITRPHLIHFDGERFLGPYDQE